jgi:ubiquinone/menaquinone biosynthesis C-methylase UbiE
MDKDKYHHIFQVQAEWTRGTRNHLYRRAGLLNAKKILEVGCGTGVILDEIVGRTKGMVFGVEKNHEYSTFSARYCQSANIITSDGFELPFKEQTFDIVLCHYYLIWTDNPRKAFAEMMRVTKAGGYIIITSEPDYDGLIEYPEAGLIEKLKSELKSDGLKQFDLGRKLISIVEEFADIIEAGVISYILNHSDIDLLASMEGCSRDSKYSMFFQPLFYVLAKK